MNLLDSGAGLFERLGDLLLRLRGVLRSGAFAFVLKRDEEDACGVQAFAALERGGVEAALDGDAFAGADRLGARVLEVVDDACARGGDIDAVSAAADFDAAFGEVEILLQAENPSLLKPRVFRVSGEGALHDGALEDGLVGFGNAAALQFAVPEFVDEGGDIAAAPVPFGEDFMDEGAEPKRVDAVRGARGQRLQRERMAGEELEGALEEGLDGGGAELRVDRAHLVQGIVRLEGGARGAMGLERGADAEAARRDGGVLAHAGLIEQERGQRGVAFLVGGGPGEKEFFRSAGAGDFEVEALFLLAFGARAEGEAFLAEGEAEGIREERVRAGAAGEFAFEQAADEDDGEFPLAGFLHVEDMDDAAAGITGPKARFGEGVLHRFPELREGDEIRGQQGRDRGGGVDNGAETGGVVAQAAELVRRDGTTRGRGFKQRGETGEFARPSGWRKALFRPILEGKQAIRGGAGKFAELLKAPEGKRLDGLLPRLSNDTAAGAAERVAEQIEAGFSVPFFVHGIDEAAEKRSDRLACQRGAEVGAGGDAGAVEGAFEQRQVSGLVAQDDADFAPRAPAAVFFEDLEHDLLGLAFARRGLDAEDPGRGAPGLEPFDARAELPELLDQVRRPLPLRQREGEPDAAGERPDEGEFGFGKQSEAVEPDLISTRAVLTDVAGCVEEQFGAEAEPRMRERLFDVLVEVAEFGVEVAGVLLGERSPLQRAAAGVGELLDGGGDGGRQARGSLRGWEEVRMPGE